MPLTSQLLMLDLNQTDGRERSSLTVVRKIKKKVIILGSQILGLY